MTPISAPETSAFPHVDAGVADAGVMTPGKWRPRGPGAVGMRRASCDQERARRSVLGFADAARAIYIRTAIEWLNYQRRKTIKNRGAFPELPGRGRGALGALGYRSEGRAHNGDV